MKEKIKKIFQDALEATYASRGLNPEDAPDFAPEAPREAKFGHFAVNCAMQSAKALKIPPRKAAEEILAAIKDPEGLIEKTEIAGPGFINITVSKSGWSKELAGILTAGDKFGSNETGRGIKTMVEFISANPTGPMHIGHGRGAVVGDVVARLLERNGFEVFREYYVNDAGAQISNFAKSLYARYRELFSLPFEIPEDGYRGEYVKEMAAIIKREIGDRYLAELNEEAFLFFRNKGIDLCMNLIKTDIKDFNIRFDNYFLESFLHETEAVKKAIETLLERGYIYDNEGALWFKSSAEGDEKDRVVYKSDGSHTYLASDIAYHKNKLDRGFTRLINIWGADHHGYIGRVNAAIKALSGKEGVLDVVLIQMVNILKDGEPVKSSKRAGSFETLRDLINEVGADAARFYFIMRQSNSPLDFDIELAKKKSQDNPVYYVQYGHARCCAILRKAEELGVALPEISAENCAALDLPEEIEILKKALEFPEVVENAGKRLAPHLVVFYLQEAIALFHSYYTKYKDDEKIISDDPLKTSSRLMLVLALKQILKNGFSILGIAAPESM